MERHVQETQIGRCPRNDEPGRTPRSLRRAQEEAQRSGQADASLDARVLSNCIFGTLIWTYKWYHPGGKVSREKLASVCSEFVLRGVIGEAPKSRPRKAKR